MVALDYLLTRTEIDPAHLGITGNSGGGTMTSWIWALVRTVRQSLRALYVTGGIQRIQCIIILATTVCLAKGVDASLHLLLLTPRVGRALHYGCPVLLHHNF